MTDLRNRFNDACCNQDYDLINNIIDEIENMNNENINDKVKKCLIEHIIVTNMYKQYYDNNYQVAKYLCNNYCGIYFDIVNELFITSDMNNKLNYLIFLLEYSKKIVFPHRLRLLDYSPLTLNNFDELIKFLFITSFSSKNLDTAKYLHNRFPHINYYDIDIVIRFVTFNSAELRTWLDNGCPFINKIKSAKKI